MDNDGYYQCRCLPKAVLNTKHGTKLPLRNDRLVSCMGLSKNYVTKNEGVKSTRFSSLADTIFPVNRLSGSSVGGNDFLVFGTRIKLFVLRQAKITYRSLVGGND